VYVVTCLLLNTRQDIFIEVVRLNVVAVYISPDSRVTLAGGNTTSTCASKLSYTPSYSPLYFGCVMWIY